MRIKILPTFDVVLECDEGLPPEERTTFHCRRLTYAEETRANEIGTKVGPSEAIRRVLQAGLTGITNLRDENGDDVPYKAVQATPLGTKLSSSPHDSILDVLPSDERVELANKITESNRLTEDDAKN